jgi:hypothetical protein
VTNYTPGIERRGYPTAVNRRDFLLFRTDGSKKTVELSCERLYMHYRDAQLAELPPDAPLDDGGEPPTRFDRRSPRQLFDALASDLCDVDVLRVIQTDWLAAEDFGREVESLAATLRARGARVEFITPNAQLLKS